MGRVRAILLILSLLFFFSPLSTDASDVSLEESIQHNLQKARAVVKTAQEKLKLGSPITVELDQLRTLSEEIKASHLLLEDRFRMREEEIRARGEKALDRHRVISDNFSHTLRQYLSFIEALSSSIRNPQSTLRNVESLLDQILPNKKKPIFGTLSYKHLKYPSREPNESPSIKPAYKGGDRTPTADDLKSTLEAPISMEIGTLAQSLTWNPVLIYEWVKNNIETEWYWGCMKGAEETLRQRRGNDCDQAALLIALLRASGYPARYVRGVIEFYPDIEKAKNLTGVDDPSKIPEYFQKAGIPHKTIVAGGKVSNIQIEHIWVETQVPYANYRGAILDEHGKTWLGLDTSIKVKGYTYNSPIDILQEISLANLRDEYLTTVQDLTPLEYVRASIETYLQTRNPPLTYNDLLKTKTLIPEVMNILPASMQYRQVKVTHEYTEVPEELKHRVRFIAARNSQPATSDEILNITLDTLKLSNQKVAISYEPETVEDQEIINSYGGLDNTPAYLIRLRPVLKINGERMAVGKDGLPMGQDFDLTVELISPNGIEKITNTHIAGNLSVIGIVSQNPSPLVGEGGGEGEKDAEQLLYEEVIKYIDRWNQAEEELASLMKLTITRPIPTVVTLGGVIDVTYLLDTPHGFEWKGVYIDNDLRTIGAVVASGFTPDGRQKTFMQVSSLQGSILENRIFEDDFQVESISTAKLFGLARNTQPATELLTIDKTNIDTILPTLPFDENIKEDIINAVNQNLAIRIPQSAIAYEDWAGLGYIKESPDTGESGYMLSGMIAGGMTAWGMDKWPEYYRDRVGKPYSEPPNPEPGSAKYIQKITKTDLQKGTVGEPLAEPLRVIVLDHEKKPVKHVEVTFTVKAGDGKFNEKGDKTIKVPTDEGGIASARLILGQETKANPTFWKEKDDIFAQQVGENIVDASLPFGTKITKPFTAYGFPKKASKIKPMHGGGKWPILSFAGFVSVVIGDIYGNPIANLPLEFEAANAVEIRQPSCENSNGDTRQAYLVKTSESCLKNSPSWGECGDKNTRAMTEHTSSQGAAAEIILGAVPDAQYQVTVTCISPKCIDPVTNKYLSTSVNYFTFPFGNCSGTEDPSIEFFTEYVYPADTYGNNINAGKVGTKIPVTARIYFLKEKETKREFTFTCGENEIPCNKVIGTRSYEIETGFNRGSVTFAGKEGSPLEYGISGGIFTSTYTLKAGINDIEINGSASIDINRTEVCPTCRTSQREFSPTRTTIMRVYGVEIQVDPIPVILVDEKGYAAKDDVISYRINPPEYKALTAFVLITKDGDPIASIPTELQGSGVATISQGFWFDVNSIYEAEVVLNYGTGVEMRSQKLKIPVGEIKVINDDPFNPAKVDEIQFSDGSNSKKRYRIELRSKVLTESCSDLSGKIRVIDRKGEKVLPPGSTTNPEEYYPTEYSLKFFPFFGQCTVKIDDSTGGGEKDRFVISNLSRAALQGRPFPSDILAAFYGGISNLVEVEVNGARKELPIEPLGIILIGIDGLRQDVLYPPEKDDVNDGGKYRVDIKNLPGLKQILENNDQPEEVQRYIMLQQVTAIFPSITFASWASIFTGEQPSKTGITGSEFFARDLYGTGPNPIPGMEDARIPAGMVSLGGGAFKPGTGFGVERLKITEFILRHGIPAEVSLFGISFGFSKNLSEKLEKSAPLACLLKEPSPVKPFFEEIGKTVLGNYSIPPNRDIRCDKTEYECRTAAIFDYYPGKSDFWGTPNASLPNIADYLLGRFSSARIMDNAPANEAVNFINGYFSRNNPQGKRKRFPAVFSIYFSGLDHYVHGEGMDRYSEFFRNTTDSAIREFLNSLKAVGEFDNKIFIIVADHGMTEMPTSMQYRHVYEVLPDSGILSEEDRPAEMSCDLKLGFQVDPDNPEEGKNKQRAERANKNLHIWELAELLKTVGSIQNTAIKNKYKILAPIEIAKIFLDDKGAELPAGGTNRIENAHIIGALNGPMAHIYVQRVSSGSVGEIFRLMLQMEDTAGALKWLGLEDLDYKQIRKTTIERMEYSIDQILVRMGEGQNSYYCVFDGLNQDGSPRCNSIARLDSTTYINSWERISGMNHPERSGDIVLLMKDDMNDISQRFSTGSACKSWHGSLNPSDSYVPFIVAYPGGNKSEIDNILKKDTLCKADYDNCKGNWKLTDVVNEIISTQYKWEVSR